MTVDDKTLAKVRALLAKAEDPATTPEEAEVYFAKAAELMAKYGIEKAMLADANPDLDRPADRVITIDGAYAVDRIGLLNHILKPLGLKSIRLRKSGGYGPLSNEVHVFGYESDIERAEILFTSLLLQAFNGMKHGRPQRGESLKAYRKTWLIGFGRAVEKRLEEIEARARGEVRETVNGRSAELVLADRKAVTEARLQEAYGGQIQKNKRKVRGSGLDAGTAAGNSADLGQTRMDGGRRALGR
ncbi:DUF2786 domain-containing protein [Streptomyces olivaceus]|uniref:DUF2786 domain-containing protein n=1 Tax=Streptomyces olivaceus TaxID=47716 RepID=UPI0036E595A9